MINASRSARSLNYQRSPVGIKPAVHAFHKFPPAVRSEVILCINQALTISLTVIECSYNCLLSEFDNCNLLVRLELGVLGHPRDADQCNEKYYEIIHRITLRVRHSPVNSANLCPRKIIVVIADLQRVSDTEQWHILPQSTGKHNVRVLCRHPSVALFEILAPFKAGRLTRMSSSFLILL